MKLKELRIGNWVNADVGLLSYQEHQIQSSEIYDYEVGLITIESIPLTEDRLDKDFIKSSGRESDQYDIQGVTYLFWGGYLRNGKGQAIKYVHTLQNVWYFDKLTGEELTID